jgi:hypothetical protein
LASTHLWQHLIIDYVKDTPCGAPSRAVASFFNCTSPPRRIVFVNIDRDTRPEYAPRRHHKVAHTSPMVSPLTNIYINKLHHVVAAAAHGPR